MSSLVLVPTEIPRSWLASLDEPDAQLEVIGGLDALDPKRDAEVAGLLSLLTMPIGPPLLDRFPQLRVVSNMAVGFDNIDVDACRTRAIAVGNTPGVLTERPRT